MKSALWSIAKYVLAVVLLVVLLKHAHADKVMDYLKDIPPQRLLLGFILISLAQLASGLRMRFIFLAAGFNMHRKFAIILFYVGAFYNFLLPGGIGGDAYKVILARKRMNVTTKDGIRIMLADRASGLCILMLTMFAGLYTFDFSGTIPHAPLLITLCMIGTLAGFLICCKWLLQKPPLVMLQSLPYSVATQALWVAALANICGALGGINYVVEYVILYCAASITAMLPISVGGLGIKETTFYYGARQLRHFAHSGVDGELGVALSLCMFFLMLATSLPGLLWLNHVEKAEHS